MPLLQYIVVLQVQSAVASGCVSGRPSIRSRDMSRVMPFRQNSWLQVRSDVRAAARLFIKKTTADAIRSFAANAACRSAGSASSGLVQQQVIMFGNHRCRCSCRSRYDAFLHFLGLYAVWCGEMERPHTPNPPKRVDIACPLPHCICAGFLYGYLSLWRVRAGQRALHAAV